MPRMPSVFVSHGSPMLALEPELPAHQFLRGAAALWPQPKAILAISPHWETEMPVVGASPYPETVYDFYGFPPALYQLTYLAPGAPELAERVRALVTRSGVPAALDAEQGYDHGVWSPLRLLYPDADIPIAQLSMQSHLVTEYQYDMGRALSALRDDGVLIFCSGTMTHNLREMDRTGRAPVADWAIAFTEWVADELAARDDAALLDYRRQAPAAARNHPSDEHLLPLFIALGAASPGVPPERIHASYAYGTQAMDCYRFD
jgi:4,5-DOPA dioxygenase extradiol